MSAPKGNTYAEKWSLSETIELIEQVKEYVLSNPDCVFIGEALTECDQYRDLWAYLKNKFRDNDKVFRTTRVIEGILERRLYEGGLNKELNARLVEFGLHNNHEWHHRKELDHTTKGDKINEIDYSKLSNDVLDEIIEAEDNDTGSEG